MGLTEKYQGLRLVLLPMDENIVAEIDSCVKLFFCCPFFIFGRFSMNFYLYYRVLFNKL